jgi:hypothetical protein
MALEEEFGIEFSDADAERMQTPRNVIDHIMRMVYGGQKRCTSRAIPGRIWSIPKRLTGFVPWCFYPP